MRRLKTFPLIQPPSTSRSPNWRTEMGGSIHLVCVLHQEIGRTWGGASPSLTRMRPEGRYSSCSEGRQSFAVAVPAPRDLPNGGRSRGRQFHCSATANQSTGRFQYFLIFDNLIQKLEDKTGYSDVGRNKPRHLANMHLLFRGVSRVLRCQTRLSPCAAWRFRWQLVRPRLPAGLPRVLARVAARDVVSRPQGARVKAG